MVVVIVGLVFALAVQTSQQFRETAWLVAHTREVLTEIESTLGLLKDAQTGMRGFVITGQESFLDPYRDALSAMGGQLQRIQKLTTDNPNQQRQLAELERLVASNLEFRAGVIRVAREQGLEAGQQLIATGKGKQGMDAIRKVIYGMEGEQERLLRQRQQSSESNNRRALYAQAALATLVAAVLLVAYLLVRQHLADRQRAEEERDRFFTLSLDMLCIANADGYFKRVSPAFTRTLGWGVEELLARPFLDFVHPDDRAATLREVERQVATGEPVLQFENRYHCKDGSWRVLSWKSAPQPGGMMYATARDVTELKHAEDRLRETNESIKLAYEVSEIGRWELDLVTLKAYRSLRHDQIFGHAALLAEWSYEIFLSYVHPEDRERVNRVFQQSLTAGKDWDFGCRITWQDGSAHWIWGRGRVFHALDGKPTRMLGTVADITERKQVEEKIRRLNEDLAQRAVQLEEANKELESFSHSVSHDLRAPLRHVQGYVEMVVKDAGAQLSVKAQRYLKIIGDASGEMGQLIDDLLSFSRMGRVEMQQTKVDLEQLVRETLAGLASQIEGRNIIWKNDALPLVQADPSLIKQVFVNLLSNALKYTRPRDPAVIEIGVMECGSDGVMEKAQESATPLPQHSNTSTLPSPIVLFVRDNGVGFDMKYVHKLFGVFQRLHTENEFTGTGVGLATVQRIIGRHGGRVWAEGAVDAGARFYFSLPAED